MKKEIRGIWYKKNGYYYVRISYYVGEERKHKNFPTGMKVDKRKEKSWIGKRTRKSRRFWQVLLFPEVRKNV